MPDRPILTLTPDFAARLRDADDQIKAGNTVRLTGMTDAELWAYLNKAQGTDHPMPATFGDDDA